MKNNRKCFFCGQDFYYCPTCPNDSNKPTWHVLWCSEKCKDLDNVVAAHRSGKITTEEAQKRIKELNAKDLKFARETLKEYFNGIMSYKPTIVDKKENEIKVENVDDTVKSVEKDVVTTSSTKTVDKTKRTKIVPKSKAKESNEIKLKEDLVEEKK